MKTCCFVLKPACKNGGPAVYCGAKTSYTNPKDDDGNRYRKYNTWCDEHEEEAKKLEAQND